MAIDNELGDFVGTPGETHVFVLVGNRAKFARIRCPGTDHGRRSDGSRLLTKRIEQHGIAVIFHHLVTEPASDSSVESAKTRENDGKCGHTHQSCLHDRQPAAHKEDRTTYSPGQTISEKGADQHLALAQQVG